MPVGKAEYVQSDGSDTEKKTADSMQKYISSHSSSGFYLTDSPERDELSALDDELTARFGKRHGGYILQKSITPEVYNAVEAYCRSYLGSKTSEPAKGMVSACPSDSGVCGNCSYSLFCGKNR